MLDVPASTLVILTAARRRVLACMMAGGKVVEFYQSEVFLCEALKEIGKGRSDGQGCLSLSRKVGRGDLKWLLREVQTVMKHISGAVRVMFQTPFPWSSE